MKPSECSLDSLKNVSAQGKGIPKGDRFTQGNAYAANLLFIAQEAQVGYSCLSEQSSVAKLFVMISVSLKIPTDQKVNSHRPGGPVAAAVGVLLVVPAPKTKTGHSNCWALTSFKCMNYCIYPSQQSFEINTVDPSYWHREVNTLTTEKWVVTTSQPISSSLCNVVMSPLTILWKHPGLSRSFCGGTPRTESTISNVSEMSSP